MGMGKPSSGVEELREKVRKKFVEAEAYPLQRALELADKFADLATLTKNGDVSVKFRGTTKEKVAAVAITKFLGEQLKETLNVETKADITVDDAARYAGIDKPVAIARLKDLVDGKLLERISRGVFCVRSFSRAEEWIKDLHQKYVKRKS